MFQAIVNFTVKLTYACNCESFVEFLFRFKMSKFFSSNLFAFKRWMLNSFNFIMVEILVVKRCSYRYNNISLLFFTHIFFKIKLQKRKVLLCWQSRRYLVQSNIKYEFVKVNARTDKGTTMEKILRNDQQYTTLFKSFWRHCNVTISDIHIIMRKFVIQNQPAHFS